MFINPKPSPPLSTKELSYPSLQRKILEAKCMGKYWMTPILWEIMLKLVESSFWLRELYLIII
jgi:hypothetical protein